MIRELSPLFASDFFFSLIFSASSLHHVMCGTIGTHFRTEGMNPELWLSEITNGVTTL